MNSQQIRDAISASPELTALAQAGNPQAIAEALSVGRTKTMPTEVGNGTILEVLGMQAGNALLDVINNAIDFRYVKSLVEQGRLRLDSPLTIGSLQSLVPSVLTQAQVNALVAKATVSDSITWQQVAAALEA